MEPIKEEDAPSGCAVSQSDLRSAKKHYSKATVPGKLHSKVSAELQETASAIEDREPFGQDLESRSETTATVHFEPSRSCGVQQLRVVSDSAVTAALTQLLTLSGGPLKQSAKPDLNSADEALLRSTDTTTAIREENLEPQISTELETETEGPSCGDHSASKEVGKSSTSASNSTRKKNYCSKPSFDRIDESHSDVHSSSFSGTTRNTAASVSYSESVRAYHSGATHVSSLGTGHYLPPQSSTPNEAKSSSGLDQKETTDHVQTHPETEARLPEQWQLRTGSPSSRNNSQLHAKSRSLSADPDTELPPIDPIAADSCGSLRSDQAAVACRGDEAQQRPCASPAIGQRRPQTPRSPNNTKTVVVLHVFSSTGSNR